MQDFCSLGHRRGQGQVLRGQLPAARRHRRRQLQQHLRAHHVQGHGELPALGRRAAVRRRLALRGPARLLQPDAQGPRQVRGVHEEVQPATHAPG